MRPEEGPATLAGHGRPLGWTAPDVACRRVRDITSIPYWRQRLRPFVGEQGLRRVGRVRRAALALGGLAGLPRTAAAYGTDKWGGHWYARHYHRHLRHLRVRQFVLVEIGIGGYDDPNSGGESLRMWKRFFPRAHIVGVDIADKSPLREGRISIFQGDQSDPQFLREVVQQTGRPLVVVDDGSHVPRHVRASFEVLFPLLQDGGLYCIEDLQTSYWPAWGGSVDRDDPTTSMAMVKALVDGLNYEEFLDDHHPSYSDRHVVAVHAYHNLVIIEKGTNAEGTNKHLAAQG